MCVKQHHAVWRGEAEPPLSH